jgi:ribosomal protein L5
MAARLKEKYNKEIKPALQKELGIDNPMAVPRLDKIVEHGPGRSNTEYQAARPAGGRPDGDYRAKAGDH